MNVLEMQIAVSEDSIRGFVSGFYGEVRRDPELGPFFGARISDSEWPTHLERMTDFWSTALLATGSYRGNPLVVHQGLAGIRPSHFQRWLHLFEATAMRSFPDRVASSIVSRARRMGARLEQVSVRPEVATLTPTRVGHL